MLPERGMSPHVLDWLERWSHRWQRFAYRFRLKCPVCGELLQEVKR